MKITNFKLGIGFPLTFPFVQAPFMDSFIRMDKPEFIYFRQSNGPLEKLRNNMVNDAFRNHCTHLIMMDTDQIYHPLTITKLLSHKLPVVGALVHRRYPPFDPLMLKGKVNHYKTIDDYEEGSLVEVDATGTGCLLFNMEVFKKIDPPWFKFIEGGNGSEVIGEDIYFCTKLREAGFKIYVDTSVAAGHLSTLSVTNQTYKLYKNMKYMQTHGIDLSQVEMNTPKEVE